MAFAEPPDRTDTASGSPVPLTRREREILRALAEGMSGAQIAEQLVLSPETVRTHVRNAMGKLGASTRSQAVALALQHRMITADPEGAALPEPASESASRSQADQVSALMDMLTGLVSLYDVDGGAVYLAEDDGLGLVRVAEADPDSGTLDLPSEVALGEGTLGRAALERRAQLLQAPGVEGAGRGAVIAAPMLGAGRMVGMIALGARVSRPIGRNELLLLQAFANRVGEVLLAGGDVGRRLERAMQRFQTSWSGSPRT
jgi:DNA-binding CsgD family transcriptional regulator